MLIIVFSEHTWPWTQFGSLRYTIWLQARLKMYSNYPMNWGAGRKPAGQIITGKHCCGQGCPLPPGGCRLSVKRWPLGVSCAFGGLCRPQKSEGDALQPSSGSEIFRHCAVGSQGAVVCNGGVKGDGERLARLSTGVYVSLQIRKGSLKCIEESCPAPQV